MSESGRTAEVKKESLALDKKISQAISFSTADVLPDGVVIADESGRFVFANKAAEKILGLKRSSITERAFNDPGWQNCTVAGEPFPEEELPVARVLRTGEPVEGIECSVVWPDATRRFVSINAAPLKDPNGRVVGVVAAFSDITQRKETELALAESTRRMQWVLDSITDALFSLDREWRFTYVNREAARQFRKSLEDLLGRNIWELFPNAVETEFYHHYHRAMDHHETASFEAYNGPLDIWVAARVYPSEEGISVYCTDISHLMRSRLRLQESEAHHQDLLAELEAVLEAVPAAVWISRDRECRTIIGNAESYELLKMPKGSNISKSAPERERPGYRAFHNGAELPPEQLPMQQAAAEGTQIRNMEFSLLFPDGSLRYILQNAAPLRDRDGNIRGAVSAALDITERKRHELALAESQQFYKVMGDTIPYGVWMCNARGEAVYMSDAFLNLLEMTLEEAQRFGWSHRLYPGTQEKTLQKWLDCVARRDIWDDEHIILGPDGEYHTVLTRGRPVFDEQGNLTAYVGINLDITDRKALERELALARREAERRAAELQSVLASMADGVILFDTEGRIIFINGSGRTILGVPPDETFDDWHDRYPLMTPAGSRLPPSHFFSERVLRGETVRNRRYRVRNPAGQETVISVSASPIRGPEGILIGAAVVFRDENNQVEFEVRQQALYEREARIAEMLQQTLLPPDIPHHTPGVKIAVRYQPALREAEVGGDFYDVFPIGPGRYGVLIGDVAGKGLKAAMHVAAARYTVRSYASLDPLPAKVVTLTNEALSRGADPRLSGMMTLIFAAADASSGIVTFCSGGHEPPLVVRAEGRVENIERIGGRALGVMGDCIYSQARCLLNPGDKMVLVTDGITEARKGESLFSREGMVDCLANHERLSVEETASHLLECAVNFAGGSLQDDAAIVVIEMERSG